MKLIRMATVVVALSGSAALAGCNGGSSLVSTATSTTAAVAQKATVVRAQQPIHWIVEADRLAFDTPAKMCPATMVLAAVALHHGTGHWNTTDGTRPAVSDLDIQTKGYDIYTPVQLGGIRQLLNRDRQAARWIVTAGGQAGSDTIKEEDLPQLSDGGRYLMVLVPSYKPGGLGPDYSTLLVIDAFPIDAAGNVLFNTTVVNSVGRDVAAAPTAVSLLQIEAQLRNCP